MRKMRKKRAGVLSVVPRAQRDVGQFVHEANVYGFSTRIKKKILKHMRQLRRGNGLPMFHEFLDAFLTDNEIEKVYSFFRPHLRDMLGLAHDAPIEFYNGVADGQCGKTDKIWAVWYLLTA